MVAHRDIAPRPPRTSPPASSSPLSSAAARKTGGRRERRWPKEVRVNERFVKVAELLEAAQTVWVVWHTVDQPGLPRHVKLVQEDDPKRTATVAVSALADRRLYRRLDPLPTPVGADQRVVIEGEDARDDKPRATAPHDNLVPFLRTGREEESESTGERASG